MKFLPPRRPVQPIELTAVSLSGSVDAERLRRGEDRLRALGFETLEAPASLLQWRYFAGTDEDRLHALQTAIQSGADIIMFSRGGYGASRLLHRINWHQVAESGKTFCGFSDITAFSLAALSQARAITFAGPVIAGEFALTDDLAAREFTEQQFLGLLAADSYTFPAATSDVVHRSQQIEGTLWGTNLAMVTHLIGTPYLPHIGDGILVLEDIGEAPYRVERMFWQLKHAGILDRQRAIILGAFTDCDPAAGMRYPYSMAEALETLREIAACPVLTGFPFGHIPAKVTLPMGAPASLEIYGSEYRLGVHDYFA
jgi:muramoyltetrapeptide carboxypeptidase